MDDFKFIRPMKARPYEEAKHRELFEDDDSGWWLELKMNGHRAYASNTDIVSSLNKPKKNLYGHLTGIIPAKYVLDTELVVPGIGCNSNIVSTAISKAPETIELSVIDLLVMDGVEVWTGMDAKERRRQAEKIVAAIGHPKIKMVTKVEKNKMKVVTDWIEDGWEGGILRKATGKYKPGSRTELIKMKGEEDYDVVITSCNTDVPMWRVRPGHVGTDGILYPSGLMSDTAKAGYKVLGYGWYCPRTKQFREVGTLGKSGPESELKQYVGQVARVHAWSIYDTGCLQHPQLDEFRDDKEPEECTFNFKD